MPHDYDYDYDDDYDYDYDHDSDYDYDLDWGRTAVDSDSYFLARLFLVLQAS